FFSGSIPGGSMSRSVLTIIVFFFLVVLASSSHTVGGQEKGVAPPAPVPTQIFTAKRSEEHTSELQSRFDLVCRLLLEKQNRLPRSRRTSPTNYEPPNVLGPFDPSTTRPGMTMLSLSTPRVPASPSQPAITLHALPIHN